ncbi:hypothetical protein S40285_10379 [Stachybotrys chlorohalonatus IBT 40285]|jgi:hypothetical protein|uniref:Uncharacterized protein n=1 Tax=Stachybotrys chlorohalonatus (strain IBT 40285) TaxID=1283841 RepID=A0A084QER1_STAC4|nr:hypothetical protein S40285_10379 [Stachybotrys chlorohalonata IBT 40285]
MERLEAADQARRIVKAREILEELKGLRLKVALVMTEYKNAVEVDPSEEGVREALTQKSKGLIEMIPSFVGVLEIFESTFGDWKSD